MEMATSSPDSCTCLLTTHLFPVLLTAKSWFQNYNFFLLILGLEFARRFAGN